MSRPQKSRRIVEPPKMKGFKPYGIHDNKKGKIILHLDEYESLKLVNYENLSQEEAALRMEVSRPTLTRIYNSALRKIVKGMVEGKRIVIKGGNINLEHDWYRCKQCNKLIVGLENHTKCEGCEFYNGEELIPINDN